MFMEELVLVSCWRSYGAMEELLMYASSYASYVNALSPAILL